MPAAPRTAWPSRVEAMSYACRRVLERYLNDATAPARYVMPKAAAMTVVRAIDFSMGILVTGGADLSTIGALSRNNRYAAPMRNATTAIATPIVIAPTRLPLATNEA